MFLQVCLGIWTAEAVEVYELRELCTSMSNKPIEEIIGKITSVTVGSRVIAFQALGPLTLFSMLVIYTASSPLFVQASATLLVKNMPGLIVTWKEAWEKATRRELRRRAETDTDLSDHQWILYVDSISLIVSTSRVIWTLACVTLLIVAILVLFFGQDESIVTIGFYMLACLFPVALAKALIVIVYLGKALDVRDSDFRCKFYSYKSYIRALRYVRRDPRSTFMLRREEVRPSAMFQMMLDDSDEDSELSYDFILSGSEADSSVLSSEFGSSSDEVDLSSYSLPYDSSASRSDDLEDIYSEDDDDDGSAYSDMNSGEMTGEEEDDAYDMASSDDTDMLDLQVMVPGYILTKTKSLVSEKESDSSSVEMMNMLKGINSASGSDSSDDNGDNDDISQLKVNASNLIQGNNYLDSDSDSNDDSNEPHTLKTFSSGEDVNDQESNDDQEQVYLELDQSQDSDMADDDNEDVDNSHG